MSDLDTELAELKATLARRIRERLEGDGPLPPSFLDVARRFLLDQTPKRVGTPKAPPIVENLPFPPDDE